MMDFCLGRFAFTGAVLPISFTLISPPGKTQRDHNMLTQYNQAMCDMITGHRRLVVITSRYKTTTNTEQEEDQDMQMRKSLAIFFNLQSNFGKRYIFTLKQEKHFQDCLL